MSITVKESSTNQANRKMLAGRCSVNDTLALIGKRWLMTVLYEVSQGHNQFSSLRRNLADISDHVLSARINNLATNGLLVKNEVKNSVPLQITYTVTQKGVQLLKIVGDLEGWNQRW